MRKSAIHEVAQVLPPGRWQEFDPFLLMAEDWFRQGTFAEHPHRGIETVTYVISGRMGHYDNKTGHGGVLGPGDVQWMTAGHGVIHQEDPLPGEVVHSLQLWVNLPKELKSMTPRYQDLPHDRVPASQADGVLIRVYSGRMAGLASDTKNVAPVTMAEVQVAKGQSATLDLDPEHNGFLYILEGEGIFGPDAFRGTAGEVLWLSHEGDALSLRAKDHLRFVIYTGKPLHQPVVAYGPFVMTTMDEIRQAFDDYHSGRFLE
ncbi:pirin family protein [Sulfobacillus sp. DSM 109850]|uniref:Pirin family protein n=2 Tax=Sulfobacillus harzensis TaxID=2729629 RepID=A0A7Y0L584_9FIRM|nr:pirin family protein [Sulfobacillus harzensis]